MIWVKGDSEVGGRARDVEEEREVGFELSAEEEECRRESRSAWAFWSVRRSKGVMVRGVCEGRGRGRRKDGPGFARQT